MVAENVSVAVLASFCFAACGCRRVKEAQGLGTLFCAQAFPDKPVTILSPRAISSSRGEVLGVSRTGSVSAFCTFVYIFPCGRQNNQAGFWLSSVTFSFNPRLYFPSFLPQPVINGYRNKSTFSVNRGPDGNPKTVGLYVGTGRGQRRTRSWVEDCWCGLGWGKALL